MAHFAELDENNIVTRVLVVNNEDCLDEMAKNQNRSEHNFYTQFLVGTGNRHHTTQHLDTTMLAKTSHTMKKMMHSSRQNRIHLGF